MTSPLRYGMLGAGGYGRQVNRLLGQIGGATLVAACDTDMAQASAMAAPSGARAYTDFQAMLDKEEMDILFACLPPFAHTGQEVQAVDRGLHLYVAKPICLDYEYAAEVDRAIDRSGVVSCVSYAMRFAAGVVKARELLAGNPVCLAEGQVCQRALPGGRRSWFVRKAQSRGQMFTQACHLYDLFRFMVGEVDEVWAVKGEGFVPRSEEYDIEPSGVVTLKFAGGAVGQVSCTVLAPAPMAGMIGFKLTAPGISVAYSNHDGILHVVDGKGPSDYGQPVKGDEYVGAQLRIFVEAIRTGDRSRLLTPYKDALKSLRIALAADESLRTGQRVSLAGD